MTTEFVHGADLAPPGSVTRSSRRRASPSTIVLLALLALVVLVAIFAPLLAPDGATQGTPADSLQGIGASGHLLGTDNQGRDVLSRILIGTRLSLITGLVPVLIAGFVGSVLGICAGLGRRWLNPMIMRTLDVFYSFPDILLAIAIGAALGPSIRNVIIAISVVLIAPVARVVESEVLALRETDFMRSARCSGAPTRMIARYHVVPNVIAPIVVYCTSLVGTSIVEAAGLSFLGLGAAPPTAEWGLMLNDGENYILTNPSVALVPAVAILLLALLFNAVGDRLRVEMAARDGRARS